MISIYIEQRVERDSIDGCPSCGSCFCTLEDTDYTGKEHVAYYTCDACGLEFAEVYGYKHTEYTKEVSR